MTEEISRAEDAKPRGPKLYPVHMGNCSEFTWWRTKIKKLIIATLCGAWEIRYEVTKV